MEYRRSEALASAQNSVVLLIDLQDRLLDVMANKEEVTANSIKLIAVAGILGVPVLATEQNPERLGPTNSAVLEALGGVKPISKVYFSCFGSDEFRATLRSLGRTRIITAGVESHVCVSQTVLDGANDYTFFVAADAVSSRTVRNRDLGLERMRRAGAVIGTTEMFLYELLEQAGTEQFRAALKHLK